MNQNSKKTKKAIFSVLAIVLLIAGFADIKYKGLFFRLLPESLQKKLMDII